MVLAFFHWFNRTNKVLIGVIIKANNNFVRALALYSFCEPHSNDSNLLFILITQITKFTACPTSHSISIQQNDLKGKHKYATIFIPLHNILKPRKNEENKTTIIHELYLEGIRLTFFITIVKRGEDGAICMCREVRIK